MLPAQDSRRKTRCCQCDSYKVARIIYGMPDFTERLEKLEKQGKIVFGGCSVSGNDPKYECTECGTGYYKRPTGKDPNWTGKIDVQHIEVSTTLTPRYP